MEFAKGHGTGNDFVIVPDHDNSRPLTPDEVSFLCNRRTGIGGDGLLRVIPTAAYLEDSDTAPAADLTGAKWFMDYYNADGSVSEMCGNGVRVFARYLLEQGMASGDHIKVATRAGIKEVRIDGDNLVVDMGPAEFGPTSQASLEGYAWPGQAVSMGNPHLVCHLGSQAEVDDLNLHTAPIVDKRIFPHGANVEFIAGEAPHIHMRVFERGVGETASCGTGTCAAAAVALRHSAGPIEPGTVATGSCRVDVPGGTLHITVTAETILMSGPALIVASGTVRL
ncbi:diaminopimelate epimerase [Natronoglycomyces albus]|uniref:diaminopimelate epimerase n=1 Tax=Natronoglycomyces albus TaxID=2811108 RepID=UPI0031B61AB4